MMDVDKQNISDWLENVYNATEQIAMLAKHRGEPDMNNTQRLAFIETAAMAIFGVLNVVTGDLLKD